MTKTIQVLSGITISLLLTSCTKNSPNSINSINYQGSGSYITVSNMPLNFENCTYYNCISDNSGFIKKDSAEISLTEYTTTINGGTVYGNSYPCLVSNLQAYPSDSLLLHVYTFKLWFQNKPSTSRMYTISNSSDGHLNNDTSKCRIEIYPFSSNLNTNANCFLNPLNYNQTIDVSVKNGIISSTLTNVKFKLFRIFNNSTTIDSSSIIQISGIITEGQ